MPVDPSFTVYQNQPTALYHGLAVWNPDPSKRIYNNVSIGDVGYLHQETFVRLFNVTLPWDHPSNGLVGKPEPYEPLNCGPFTNVSESRLFEGAYYSRYVSAETNDSGAQAKVPDE